MIITIIPNGGLCVLCVLLLDPYWFPLLRKYRMSANL